VVLSIRAIESIRIQHVAQRLMSDTCALADRLLDRHRLPRVEAQVDDAASGDLEDLGQAPSDPSDVREEVRTDIGCQRGDVARGRIQVGEPSGGDHVGGRELAPLERREAVNLGRRLRPA